MKSEKVVLSLDPSGNFNEGKGTTGWCVSNNGYIFSAGQIPASDYKDQMTYWKAVLNIICKYWKQPHTEFTLVVEDYRLYASPSKAQINSNLETPQLIGAIKFYCYINNIPLHLQMASEVKTRWSNEILLEEGIVSKGARGNYHCGKIELSNHSMDALRHNVHYTTFKNKKREPKNKEKQEYARY